MGDSFFALVFLYYIAFSPALQEHFRAFAALGQNFSAAASFFLRPLAHGMKKQYNESNKKQKGETHP
jgi:hypothetical protein